MQTVELAILNWIQANCRCPLLDVLMPAVSLICNHGEIWILAAAGLLLFKKTRSAGVTVALALGMHLLICNGLLKPLIGRIRPCDVNTAVQLLIAHPADASFPSGHASASFAAVSAMKASGCRLWRAAFVLAVLISFSRLYLYVHWPSDILGGAVLGIALGFASRRAILYFQARRGRLAGR